MRLRLKGALRLMSVSKPVEWNWGQCYCGVPQQWWPGSSSGCPSQAQRTNASTVPSRWEYLWFIRRCSFFSSVHIHVIIYFRWLESRRDITAGLVKQNNMIEEWISHQRKTIWTKASFGLSFYFQIWIKNFTIMRRFAFLVLQVNSSLPFTMLEVSYTTSEFLFHLRARKWGTPLNSGSFSSKSEKQSSSPKLSNVNNFHRKIDFIVRHILTRF